MARKKDPFKFKKVKKPYILCLTEGQNTEPLYLKHVLNADTYGVEVEQSRCCHALGIVEEAIKIVRRLAERIDTLYAVFDREFPQDETEGDFLNRFKQIDQKLVNYQCRIIPICSSPSFEYVLLLHFKESNRSYHDNQTLIKELKAQCTSYGKNKEDSIRCFNELGFEQIKNASERLKKRDKSLFFTKDTLIRDRACKNSMPNSNFHVLIDALTNNKT